jgi:hypothetical protein
MSNIVLVYQRHVSLYIRHSCIVPALDIFNFLCTSTCEDVIAGLRYWHNSVKYVIRKSAEGGSSGTQWMWKKSLLVMSLIRCPRLRVAFLIEISHGCIPV